MGQRYPVFTSKQIGESITIIVPDPDIPPTPGRMFAHHWALSLFCPAARIEGAIIGQPVHLEWRPN
jgi:hypothetical protein